MVQVPVRSGQQNLEPWSISSRIRVTLPAQPYRPTDIQVFRFEPTGPSSCSLELTVSKFLEGRRVPCGPMAWSLFKMRILKFDPHCRETVRRSSIHVSVTSALISRLIHPAEVPPAD